MTRFFCFFLLVASLAANTQGITFETSTWQEILQKAEEQEKLIFVDAYAKWCGPCKVMASNVFTNAEVGNTYNKHFLNVKIDMESTEGREFGKKYPVSAYPTLLFIDGNGKIVKKVVGGLNIENFISLGIEASKLGGPTLEELESKYKEGDRSYKMMQKYLSTLSRSGKSTTKILNEFFASNPPINENEKAMLLYEASLDADSKVFEQMVDYKKNIIDLVGESAYNEKIKRACSSTVKKAIEYELTSLLEEAISKGNKYMSLGAKEFELRSRMEYAKSFKDANGYLKNTSEYADLILKNNPSDIYNLITEMCQSFPKDKNITTKAKDLAEKLYKKDQRFEVLSLYASMLSLVGSTKNAISIVEKAKSKIDKANTPEILRYDTILEKLRVHESSK